MTSNYSRDPRVPPAHVEHLGKHHRSPSQRVQETPAVGGARASGDVDTGPTYDDFLEHDPVGDELPDKTG